MASNTGAPRISVEIGAITTDLKKGLADARAEIQKFNKEVGKSEYKNVLDAERLATQKARTEAVNFASTLKSSLAESLNNARVYTENARKSTEDYRQTLLSNKSALEQSRVATEQQRQATEAERTALANSRSELARIAVEKRKGQQATVALAGSYREAQQRLTALGKSIREAEGGFKSTTPAIRGQISEYRKLNDQLKTFDRTMGNNQRNVGNYPQLLGAVSPSLGMLTGGLGTAVVGIGALTRILGSAKDAIFTFDTGLKNVQKTTGLSQSEISNLSKEFVGLSRNLQTVSPNKLTEYATVAGQLGVKGSENIISFTEALAKLETASNISGEQGGAEIARLLTLTDGGVQNVRKFADEIVNLGNNFPATEKEILANAEAIAQNVGIYKIGRQDILAFATATKSVGVEAELVGSTFNRTLAVFESAIRTGGGLSTVLKLVGGTQESLSRRFKEDSAGVFVDFIKSLNTIDKAGGSVNEQLENLGINAVRDQRVIQSLAVNGYDVLTRSIDTVRDSVGSLDTEFKTKSESLVNQTNRISVAWENLVLSIDDGNNAIGRFTKNTAGGFANTLDALSELISGTDTFLGKLEFFSAFSPIAMIDRALDKSKENRFTGAPFDVSGILPTKSASDFAVKGIQETTQATTALGAEAIKNKAYWEGQVASLKAVRDALSSADVGTKKWIETTNALNKAQAQVDLFSNKKPKGSSQAKKDLEEVKRLTEEITKSNLSAYDQKLFDIDKKYANIIAKISDPKLLGLAEQNKQAEVLRASIEQLNESLKVTKTLGSGMTTTTGVLTIPTAESMAGRRLGTRIKAPKIELDEFTSQFQSTLRRGLSSTFNDFFSGLNNLSNASYEVEKKYSDLRKDASASQIVALNEMERIERSINNGLTNTLSKIGSTFSQIGGNLLSSALSTGIASGDFKDIKGLFSGDKKAMGYGALGSLLGGAIGGALKPTDTVGQGLSGALSGAGTGAAIGSLIAPGVGTIVGAIGGALIGGLSSILGSSKAKKQEELAQKQYEEQKKQTLLMERQAQLAYSSQVIGVQTVNGAVTSIERNEFGELVADIKGTDIALILQRVKSGR